MDVNPKHRAVYCGRPVQIHHQFWCLRVPET